MPTVWLNPVGSCREWIDQCCLLSVFSQTQTILTPSESAPHRSLYWAIKLTASVLHRFWTGRHLKQLRAGRFSDCVRTFSNSATQWKVFCWNLLLSISGTDEVHFKKSEKHVAWFKNKVYQCFLLGTNQTKQFLGPLWKNKPQTGPIISIASALVFQKHQYYEQINAAKVMHFKWKTSQFHVWLIKQSLKDICNEF